MSDLRSSARWLSEQLRTNHAAVQALSAPQLGTSSIEAGQIEEYDQDGTLVSVTGEQFDGTHAAVTVAGPVPPEPAPPTLTVSPGQVEVRWNGLFAEDDLSPMDFSHVAVHAAREDIFEPDNTTQLATISGESGDTATVLLDPGEWSVLLVAVSRAGKWSDPSEPVPAEVPDSTPEDVQDALLDMSTNPGGVAAWRQFPRGSNSAWPVLSSTGGEVGLFEIGWDTSTDDPARLYGISVPPILLRSTNSTPSTVGLIMRYTDDGTPPTVDSPLILHNYAYASDGGYASPSFSDVLISSANGPYIRVLVSMWSNGAVKLDDMALPEVIVKDLGLSIPQTGSITTGGGGSNPPPTNPVVTKTVEYGHTSVKSFLGDNTAYNYNTTKGYQGLQPDTGNGNLKSLWTFPSLTSILTGATVNEIWAYFYFDHWNNGSGGTARIVVHGNSGQPVTYSSLVLAISSPNWPRESGRWVKIPSSLYAGFKTGTYKGFGLEGDGTLNTYGIASAARIRVKYTK